VGDAERIVSTAPVVVLAFAAALGACVSHRRPTDRLPTDGWIDVTATLTPGVTPVYEGDAPMQFSFLKDMRRGDGLSLSTYTMGAHSGTHVDAPMHFIRDGAPVDAVSLSALIGPVRVIEIADSVTVIDRAQLEQHAWRDAERLFFRTRSSIRGWMTSPGFHRDFAYFTADAAQAMVDAGVRLIGIDYLSAEQFGAPEPVVHRIVLGRGVPIVEGLVLGAIRGGDYDGIVMPIKVGGHDGAPARVVLRPVARRR
jgi:arylformamidase